jgi:FKBP-type peptidyl-prolyl cis-trans isomerase SlpA
METVKEGDKVQLICEAKLEDGTICIKNEQDKPYIFTVGEGRFLPAIEKELKDMKIGETKTITLEPKDAFGVHNDGLVTEISKKDLNTDADLKIGSRIQMKTPEDKIIQGMITEINNDKLTIDFNHPLVDKKIIFTVTVRGIEKN